MEPVTQQLVSAVLRLPEKEQSAFLAMLGDGAGPPPIGKSAVPLLLEGGHVYVDFRSGRVEREGRIAAKFNPTRMSWRLGRLMLERERVHAFSIVACAGKRRIQDPVRRFWTEAGTLRNDLRAAGARVDYGPVSTKRGWYGLSSNSSIPLHDVLGSNIQRAKEVASQAHGKMTCTGRGSPEAATELVEAFELDPESIAAAVAVGCAADFLAGIDQGLLVRAWGTLAKHVRALRIEHSLVKEAAEAGGERGAYETVGEYERWLTEMTSTLRQQVETVGELCRREGLFGELQLAVHRSLWCMAEHTSAPLVGSPRCQSVLDDLLAAEWLRDVLQKAADMTVPQRIPAEERLEFGRHALAELIDDGLRLDLDPTVPESVERRLIHAIKRKLRPFFPGKGQAPHRRQVQAGKWIEDLGTDDTPDSR